MTPDPIWDVLSPVVSWSLVRAGQNAVPPSKPYATYQIRSAVPRGLIRTEPAANGTAKLYGPLLLRIEVNFYGVGANDRARRTILGLCTEASSQRMVSHGLSVARFVTVNDLSGVVDDPQAQERALLELTMNTTDTTDDIVGCIEHVILQPDPTVEPGDPVWNDPGCGETISAANATTPTPT